MIQKIIVFLSLMSSNMFAGSTNASNIVTIDNVQMTKHEQKTKVVMIQPYIDEQLTNVYSFKRCNEFTADESFTGYYFKNEVMFFWICINDDNPYDARFLLWSDDRKLLFRNIPIEVYDNEDYYYCTLSENNIKVKVRLYK